MEDYKNYFANKDYLAAKNNIEADPYFEKDFSKLQYLVSANYYLRDFEGSIKAIKWIEAFDLKKAYSMYIDAHIMLGTDAEKAAHYVGSFLTQSLTKAELNWAHFKKGQCLLALSRKTEAIASFLESDLCDNADVDLERHYFLNSSLGNLETSDNAAKSVNFLIIESRLKNSPEIAYKAFEAAHRISYGEGEYYAAVVLSKDFHDGSALNKLFPQMQINSDTLYYLII